MSELPCPPEGANLQETWHGEPNAYHRCRRHFGVACSECRASWTASLTARRAEYAGPDPENNRALDHGSPWTRTNYRCPCAPCREALNLHIRERNAARRAAR